MPCLQMWETFSTEGQYSVHGKTVDFMILLKILFPLTNLALSQRLGQWASGRREPQVCQGSPLLGWWHPLKLQNGKPCRGQAAGVWSQVPTVSQSEVSQAGAHQRSRCLEKPQLFLRLSRYPRVPRSREQVMQRQSFCFCEILVRPRASHKFTWHPSFSNASLCPHDVSRHWEVFMYLRNKLEKKQVAWSHAHSG